MTTTKTTLKSFLLMATIAFGLQAQANTAEPGYLNYQFNNNFSVEDINTLNDEAPAASGYIVKSAEAGYVNYDYAAQKTVSAETFDAELLKPAYNDYN